MKLITMKKHVDGWLVYNVFGAKLKCLKYDMMRPEKVKGKDRIIEGRTKIASLQELGTRK
jgi:hypothetical protein